MRGSYMQSFWSIDTDSAGGLAVSLAPLVTCTQTFSSLPFFTRTEGSVMVFFAQYGSASRCSLPGVGALPPKSTVPSMDSALVAEVPEAGHPCPVHQRLRVLEPDGDPVRPQPLLGKQEVGRGAGRILVGPQLPDHMAVDALQFLEERLGLAEPLSFRLGRLGG